MTTCWATAPCRSICLKRTSRRGWARRRERRRSRMAGRIQRAISTFLLILGAASASLAAALPPDLATASRQIEQLAATKGQGSESERLRQFFELYWRTRMLGGPELATYIGYPGLDDRLSDDSPEALALGRRITREELVALTSIDRSRLAAPEQLNYDLARWRIEQAIEGERFPQEFLAIHQLSGIHESMVQLLADMPVRNVQDFENRLARLRAFPRAVDQT